MAASVDIALISIHALLAESDQVMRSIWIWSAEFLSTLSLRRATFVRGILRLLHRDFYPRSPCGERRTSSGVICLAATISIHALLAESDGQIACGEPITAISIHALLAESDVVWHGNSPEIEISIHALLAESDIFTDIFDRAAAGISIHALLAESDQAVGALPYCSMGYFYPRSPCGERHKIVL